MDVRPARRASTQGSAPAVPVLPAPPRPQGLQSPGGDRGGLRHGEDVLLIAGTGAGKTEAALSAAWYSGEVPILAVYPTKALARDQMERLEGYGLDVIAADGDHPGWEHVLASRTPDVVVTNPEMLWRHLRREGSRLREFAFHRARTVVWDEIHFYGPRHINQLLGLVRALRDLRHVFMSATVGDPRSLKRALERVTGRPVGVVKGRGVLGPRRYVALERPSDVRELTFRILARYSEDDVKTLVYVGSRRTAEYLHHNLARRGFPVELHHGALPKDERRRVEEDFNRGEVTTVITVKTLEVGVDIGRVERIVHVGLPETAASFHQREGRAGRRGQRVESVLVPYDGWTDYVTRERDTFRRLYLEGTLERPLAYPESPLARPPGENPKEGFYAGERQYGLWNEVSRRYLDTDNPISPVEVVTYCPPGSVIEHRGGLYVVTDVPRGDVPVVPLEYRPDVEPYVRRGWWTFPVFTLETEVSNAGRGEIRLTWRKTVLGPPLGEKAKPRVLETGSYIVKVTTYAIVYEDPSADRHTLEAAAHVLTYALRERGVRFDLVRHAVHDGRLVLYEHPEAAVMKYLPWGPAPDRAVEVVKSSRRRDLELRLPHCPWPNVTVTEEGDVELERPRFTKMKVRRVLEGLRERVRELANAPDPV